MSPSQFFFFNYVFCHFGEAEQYITNEMMLLTMIALVTDET